MARPPRASTRDRGRVAEQAAASFLTARGLLIVDRNYSAAGAELDLVARQSCSDGSAGTEDSDAYVFVEVRSRVSSAHGSAVETIDHRKQRQIIRAATAWLVAHDLWERVEVRFDVIGIEVTDEGEPAAEPTWLRNAFELHG